MVTVVTVKGSTSADVITKNAANTSYIIDGLSGNDSITSGAFADTIYGGLGDDTIRAGSGNDRVFGNEGNDKLYGDAGADTIYGGANNGAGQNALTNVSGNDFFAIQDGLDKMFGEDGNDRFEFQMTTATTTATTIDGGFGLDALSFSGAYAGNITIDLQNHTGAVACYNVEIVDGGMMGNDKLYGSSANEFLNPGMGNDLVAGRLGNDQINGFNGNDSLNGGGGNDIIKGDIGSDFIFGGAGNDTMYGGTTAAERDLFYFTVSKASTTVVNGVDKIMDFQDGTDKIIFISSVLKSFIQLKITNTHDSAGYHTIITNTVTPADSIIIEGTTAHNLTAANFVFTATAPDFTLL